MRQSFFLLTWPRYCAAVEYALVRIAHSVFLSLLFYIAVTQPHSMCCWNVLLWAWKDWLHFGFDVLRGCVYSGYQRSKRMPKHLILFRACKEEIIIGVCLWAYSSLHLWAFEAVALIFSSKKTLCNYKKSIAWIFSNIVKWIQKLFWLQRAIRILKLGYCNFKTLYGRDEK